MTYYLCCIAITPIRILKFMVLAVAAAVTDGHKGGSCVAVCVKCVCQSRHALTNQISKRIYRYLPHTHTYTGTQSETSCLSGSSLGRLAAPERFFQRVFKDAKNINVSCPVETPMSFIALKELFKIVQYLDHYSLLLLLQYCFEII